jgi:ribosomal protein S12 methylthiotransferase accessory factor
MDIEVTLEGKAQVKAHFNGMTVVTDQPVPAGDGLAPTPYQLFLASLATCAGIFVMGFCKQRGIPTDDIRIIQSMQYDPIKKLASYIKIDIKLPADFPEKYKDAVISAADLCLVKRHLHEPPVIETVATIGG